MKKIPSDAYALTGFDCYRKIFKKIRKKDDKNEKV